MKRFVLTAGALVAMTIAASAASPIKVSTADGDVLAGSNTYMTLYTYEKDGEGVSNCYDACAENWLPHFAEYWDTPKAPFSTIDRNDGKKQWAKDGKPLYFFKEDTNKGDTSGDGVGGVWSVARP
jgi:predicted lipoprotein with Yx(FWY)xxD motif